ncbi:77 kDa echinoderm microtubule-associated protein-like isoform X3 [Ptychodera flava]|uniref:77 kDa echinoderm microtubule-associated protein-like isoform X3 n=1 Tax=Ptychodera flava TaxID=63121 RepID=UPI00396A8896
MEDGILGITIGKHQPAIKVPYCTCKAGTSKEDLLDGDTADRVAALEKKVSQQADDIVCLKTALADVVRRLATLEGKRSTKLTPSRPTHMVLPSKPAIANGTPKKPIHNFPMAKRPSTPEQTRKSFSPSSELRRWASADGNTFPSPTRKSASLTNLASPRLKNPGPPVSKEAYYNREEGVVKIYLRGRGISLYSPSDMKNYSINKGGQAPTEKLKLEWVYGYRGRDCRNNLHLLPTGEVVYFIAAVVVMYNIEEEMQRFYLGHTDDVKCIAIHPDKVTIATGQVAGHERKNDAKKSPRTANSSSASSSTEASMDDETEIPEVKVYVPHVRIWDSVSLTTLRIIGVGDFDRAVCCVSFSKSDGGSHLLAVDESNDRVLSVWEWNKGEKGHKITDTKSASEPVLAAEFHPMDHRQMVTCGKSHISFWTLEDGRLNKKSGIFEKYDKPKYVLCLAFADNGDVISGDSNGNIFVWGKGNTRIHYAVTAAHEGPIFGLCVMKDGTLLSGGGKDRKLLAWDRRYIQTGVEKEIPEGTGPVRTISQGKDDQILVGTTKNAILQGSLSSDFYSIVQSHTDELWGLAVHPSSKQFLTCAYDRHIILWDSSSHTQVWTKLIEDGCQSAGFHPSGTVIAIGTQTGRWLAIDASSRDLVTVHTDGNEQHDCVEYSPDGNYLAIGSHDNYIYVYAVSENGYKYNKVGRCNGHTSFITHLDWSSDSQYIQSNSGDYEVLFWNATSCRQVTSSSTMRDVDWATHHCTIGFPVCGIWQEGADGSDVNAVCRSNDRTVIATGDDFGKVNLYRYPCCQPKSHGHSYSGHSSHVTCVRFLKSDNRLISTGGKDMSIMQWKLCS